MGASLPETEKLRDTSAPSVDMPEGAALIERIGWEDREETNEHPGGRAFTATLVFPNGAPDLSAGVVWKKIPVRLVMASPPTEPASDRTTSNTDAAQVNLADLSQDDGA